MASPQLFTHVSVANILHNSIYTSQIKHNYRLLPGSHQTLVSEIISQTVQATMNVRSTEPGAPGTASVPAGRCPTMFPTSRSAE